MKLDTVQNLCLPCAVMVTTLFLCFAASGWAATPDIKPFGYIQTTAIKSEDQKAFVFGFERVCFGVKGALNDKMDYKFLVDFMATSKTVDKDGESPGIINYAQLTFKPGAKLRVSVGKFKTPLGME